MGEGQEQIQRVYLLDRRGKEIFPSPLGKTKNKNTQKESEAAEVKGARDQG